MKAQAILCIVKPDKIFLAWKPDLPNQGRLDHQAAEGADIVDERFFFVCRLRHGPGRFMKRGLAIRRRWLVSMRPSVFTVPE